MGCWEGKKDWDFRFTIAELGFIIVNDFYSEVKNEHFNKEN